MRGQVLDDQANELDLVSAQGLALSEPTQRARGRFAIQANKRQYEDTGRKGVSRYLDI